jgi:hypothetical protein
MWISKEEKEQERKKKESQIVNQFISNIVNLTKSQYPHPMGMMGPGP